ncbi:MAG: hypothetical protein WAZ18_07130 [Alphaproteobacteria bacterium]
MDYTEGARVVRRAFMDVLPVGGEVEALEAGKRMADWLGLDPAVAERAAEEWDEVRKRFVESN